MPALLVAAMVQRKRAAFFASAAAETICYLDITISRAHARCHVHRPASLPAAIDADFLHFRATSRRFSASQPAFPPPPADILPLFDYDDITLR